MNNFLSVSFCSVILIFILGCTQKLDAPKLDQDFPVSALDNPTGVSADKLAASPGYTTCAKENGVCSFVGTKQVRYGAGSTWTVRTITNGTACTNQVFGDPLFGTLKSCEILTSSFDGVLRSSAYGCVGDGNKNNDDCLRQMFADCPNQCAIEFGSGKFLFSSSQIYTFAERGDASLTLRGAGQTQTKFVFNNTDGFIFNYPRNFSSSVHFRDFMVVQQGTNRGTAIGIHGFGSFQREPITIDRVHISGESATVGGWSYGVVIDNLGFANFNEFRFTAPTSSYGVGIHLQGNSIRQTYGIQYQIANSIFEKGSIGLYYGTFIQGVEITKSQFIHNESAVVASGEGLAELAIYNCMIDTQSHGIVILSPFPQLMYSSNQQTIRNGRSAIFLAAYTTGHVANSKFIGGGSSSYDDNIGIYGKTNTPADFTISGNEFSNFKIGVFLDAGSSGYKVFNNRFIDNVTSVANNAGQTNSIDLNRVVPKSTDKLLQPAQSTPFPSLAHALDVSDYGCRGDGRTVNDQCLDRVFAACPANCVIYFGTGDYLFQQAKVYRFPEDKQRSMIFVGQGQGVTRFVYNNINGLDFTYSATKANAVQFRDLSFVQLAAHKGDAVSIHGQGGPLSQRATAFDNVSVLAQQITYGGWANGIVIDSVANVRFTSLFHYMPNATVGNGIVLKGNTTTERYAEDVRLLNCIFLSGNVSILYGSNVRNVEILNSEFTNMQTALYIIGVNTSHLYIVNSQIDTASYGIAVQQPTVDFLYANTLQYVHQSRTGIFLMASITGSIIDSDIGGVGNGTGSFGIYAQQGTVSQLMITGNRIGGFNAGIYLESGTRGFHLHDNFYTGTGLTINGVNIVNLAGTSNTVQ